MLKMADLIILREFVSIHLKQRRDLWKGVSDICNHDGKSSRNLGNRRNVGKQAASIGVYNFQI